MSDQLDAFAKRTDDLPLFQTSAEGMTERCEHGPGEACPLCDRIARRAAREREMGVDFEHAGWVDAYPDLEER